MHLAKPNLTGVYLSALLSRSEQASGCKHLSCVAWQATGAEDEGADEDAPEGDLSKERASLMHATSQGGSQAIEVTHLCCAGAPMCPVLCWCAGDEPCWSSSCHEADQIQPLSCKPVEHLRSLRQPVL